MFVVVVRWRVRPEDAAAFDALVAAQATASITEEEACRVFDVARDPSDPGRFLLYEIYDSAGDFAARCEAPHFLSFSRAVEAMTLGKVVETLELAHSGRKGP